MTDARDYEVPKPGEPQCEADGVRHGPDGPGGTEHYWTCTAPGTVNVDGMLMCEDHAGERGHGPKQEEYGYDPRTPWQADRDRAERTGSWPEAWGPFHRHFANDAIHRDGGPECDQPGTPRRVYVFDEDALDAHELAVARYAIGHPDQFGCEDPVTR